MNEYKLTDQHQRVLTEKVLGECDHQWIYKEPDLSIMDCHKCGVVVKTEDAHNRTFKTGNDLIAVKEAIERSGEWDSFSYYAFEKWYGRQLDIPTLKETRRDFTAWLLEPERFNWLAGEFEMQKKGSK